MRHNLPVPVLLAAALAASACTTPLAAPTLVPVETGVALTLQAIAAAATPIPTSTPAPLPTRVPDVLPHSLHYLNRDAAGVWQIFRLGVDGLTVQQLTFEPLNVDAFDVSSVDGSLAYVTNNQLFVVDSNGAGRRMLIDGGPLDQENRGTNAVNSPVWSMDGSQIALSHGGLSFIDPSNGAENRVLQNQIDSTAGFQLVREMYSPLQYSADGGKLLIDIGFFEGGTYGIYLPSNNALVRMERPEGGLVCCYVNWIPDGSGLYITSPVLGITESGLFHADAATGTVNTLLPGAAPDGTYNFAYAAQVGSDNRLYFFYNNLPQIPVEGHTPLYLVRSAPDGVTDRVQLQPEAFQNVNEILWAADASLAIVVTATNPDEYTGGEARLVYPDGRPAIALVPFARRLRWGP